MSESKHDHPAPVPPPPPCEHAELKLCKPCNVVECKGCGKEWKDAKAVDLSEWRRIAEDAAKETEPKTWPRRPFVIPYSPAPTAPFPPLAPWLRETWCSTHGDCS